MTDPLGDHTPAQPEGEPRPYTAPPPASQPSPSPQSPLPPQSPPAPAPPPPPLPQSPPPPPPPPPPYGQTSYGIDPITHQPLSDKSRTTAGLLQILPGFFLGLGGIGRLYAGNTVLGVVQLVATVVGWVSFWCGFLLIVPFAVFAACWIWFVVDGFVLLAGRPTDGQGRLLQS